MKKYLFIFLITILLFSNNAYAEEKLCNDENDNTYECKVPSVDNSKKIYDFAELLSESDEKTLFDGVQNFIEKYKMDLVLVTIDKNPYGVSDYYTQIYAQDFYYFNDFGLGNTHNGLIVLIDMDNRYPYIATKGDAILMFDDERINSIHDSAYDYLKSESYFEAFNAYVSKITSYASEGIPNSNKNYCINENGEYYKCKSDPKSVNWLISIGVGAGLSLLIAFIHTRKYRGIRLATNADSYLKNSDINVSNDRFLTTFTSRVRKSHDSGGSSSHGGGSSTHHGSGGSFGGGGGRHF